MKQLLESVGKDKQQLQVTATSNGMYRLDLCFGSFVVPHKISLGCRWGLLFCLFCKANRNENMP